MLKKFTLGCLKRFVAIFFLGLLLFNIAGYRLWFYYVEQKATAQLMASVEQERFEDSELITLTVPLSLPYQTDWADWEKVRGSIEIDGITYQYVQRKVERGQLVLQCLPNKSQSKIASARDRFFQLANSFHADNGGKKESSDKTVKLTKPSFTDFDDHLFSLRISGLKQGLDIPTLAHPNALISSFLPVSEQPPEWIA